MGQLKWDTPFWEQTGRNATRTSVPADYDALCATIETPNEDWQDDAKCKGVDPNLFFPARGEPAKEAFALCATCPVRVDCLAANITEKFGVWGGMAERRRRAIRARLRREGRIPPIVESYGWELYNARGVA